MNEFEWRRNLRELQQPLLPSRDLWANIESAIDESGHRDTSAAGAPPWRRRGWLFGAAVAASLLLAVGIGWHAMHAPDHGAFTTLASKTSPWKPSDPRLSGAAIELNAADLELQMAMQQAPNSLALQRLLKRTRQQQNQLRELANQPG